jgi:hypothetical protein
MTKYVGLDVSQWLCIVDGEGHRLWREECTSSPDQIVHTVLQHAGAGASIGLEPLGKHQRSSCCLVGERSEALRLAGTSIVTPDLLP